MQVSELLNHKTDLDAKSFVTSVKSKQNVTNINITSRRPSASSSNDLQVFQKGPQVTALVANLPGLELNKDSHTNLPVRSRSSMSNVSNTHIPTPTSECHKSHRQRHKHSDYIVENHHHKKHQHSYSREKDYNSETTSNTDHVSQQNKKNVDNRRYKNSYNEQNGKRYSSDMSLMDQNYKKATEIVHDLTRYEKHKQKCITASEKYNIDLLKHYNVRKSTSVLDFQSDNSYKAKHIESKSVDELNCAENETVRNKSKLLPESRSSKSLDFESDTNSVNYLRSSPKSVDYASEPLHSDSGRPRPIPPKKPLRLSLHKNHSIQSSDTQSTTSNDPSIKRELRKTVKRTHKGHAHPVSVTVKIEGPEHNNFADTSNESSLLPLKWSSFAKLK